MRVFIGCSSCNYLDKKYENIACEVSDYLASSNHKLIFGGDASGMMGKCFFTFKYRGSKAKAIVDVKYSDHVEDLEVDALEITKNTFERLDLINKSSEAIIILPGGIGVLSEMFALIEEKQTRKNDTPIIIYNFEGFFDSIIKHLDFLKENNFVSEEDLREFSFVNNMDELKYIFNNLERGN